MIIKVSKGNYEIIKKKGLILTTDYLGAGLAIGFIHKTQHIYGLLSFLFPYRDDDININDHWIYSGESLLHHFQEDLLSLKVPIEEAKWILAGGSVFKENPDFLDLSERNLKLAEAWFKRQGLWNNVISKVKNSYPLILTVNGKEERFEITIKNTKVEYYE